VGNLAHADPTEAIVDQSSSGVGPVHLSGRLAVNLSRLKTWNRTSIDLPGGSLTTVQPIG